METNLCPSCFRLIDSSVCPHCYYPRESKNQSHQLPIGTVLRERYRIGKVLGQGGFGITYLGWDTLLESKVAIKEFYPGSLVNRDCGVSTNVSCNTAMTEPYYHATLDRFLREAKALVKFRNIPEVVDIRDFFAGNNTAYIVMEYVQGMNLAEYVRRNGGKLSAAETFRILRPVMDALATVHKAGLVHRDISPDNIMLHPMGGAKLLDFGAVRSVEGAEVDKELSHSTETILKHGFAPIEQYNVRGSLGPWTDEYAMCATVYYCLTGSIPENAPARVADGIGPDWNRIPGLTGPQSAALEKGMAVRAKDRYPNMDSLIQELFPGEKTCSQVQQQEPSSDAKAVQTPAEGKFLAEKPPAAATKKMIPVLVACAVLLVGIAASLWLFRGGKGDPDSQEQPSTETSASESALVQEYLAQAELLALGYDYDGAIAVLDAYPGGEHSDITAKRQEYISAKAQLKEWTDYSSIANLGFHMLIADPTRAFADEELGGQYNKNFVTIDEFTKILDQLYTGGYVLVDFDSFTETNTGLDGSVTFFTEPICLPEGKKPIMITETMVNYFNYMVDSNKDNEPDAGGDGFAYRLIVDSNGDIKAQMVDSNGQTQTGNYDLVPILEDFIAEHPDFSYRGSRAILAVSGDEGIFGYRINTSNISTVSQAYYDEQVAGAKEIVAALREKGYTLACYTYANIAYGDKSATQIKADLQDWASQITPVIGQVDVLVYARTSDIGDYSGAKFGVLYDAGFRYFIRHGSSPSAEVNNTYVRQSRLMVTGENMAWHSDQFSSYFDCAAILNNQRGSVPKSS